MGGIIFVIFFVVAVGVIASAFLLMHRKAVKDSRRVGAPNARRTATFRGGMWRPDTFNAGPGTISLNFSTGGSAWAARALPTGQAWAWRSS